MGDTIALRSVTEHVGEERRDKLEIARKHGDDVPEEIGVVEEKTRLLLRLALHGDSVQRALEALQDGDGRHRILEVPLQEEGAEQLENVGSAVDGERPRRPLLLPEAAHEQVRELRESREQS